MSVQQAWQVTTTAITHDDWAPIVIPRDCDGFGLRSKNGLNWRLRTILEDANSEKPVLAQNQEIVTPTAPNPEAKATRFSAGDTLCWAMSDVGDDAIVCTWIGNH